MRTRKEERERDKTTPLAFEKKPLPSNTKANNNGKDSSYSNKRLGRRPDHPRVWSEEPRGSTKTLFLPPQAVPVEETGPPPGNKDQGQEQAKAQRSCSLVIAIVLVFVNRFRV